MKTLLFYLKPYRWLIILTLFLAAINIGFSLIDPILLGKLVNLAAVHQTVPGGKFDWDRFVFSFKSGEYGVMALLLASVKAWPWSAALPKHSGLFPECHHTKIRGQRYFTDGLQHAMKLPYQNLKTSAAAKR